MRTYTNLQNTLLINFSKVEDTGNTKPSIYQEYLVNETYLITKYKATNFNGAFVVKNTTNNKCLGKFKTLNEAIIKIKQGA